MPRLSDWQRLVSLGLQPQWLTAPAAGSPNSGKAPLGGPGWQSRSWWGTPGAAQPEHPPGAAQGPAPGQLAPPECNLGIQTGYVEGAPLCVVVVDCDSAAALEWARANLPPTPVRTLTGKGEHWYYRRPEAPSGSLGGRVKLTLPGGEKLDLDIKSDGGQCVAAPSVHWTGRAYTEAAPWTPALLASMPEFSPVWVGLSARRASPAASGPDPDALQRPGMSALAIRARVQFLLRRPATIGGHGGGIDRDRTIAALTATLDGATPLARPGARGATLRDVCWVLARLCPEALVGELVEYLTPALQALGDGWASDSDWGLPGAAAKLASARRKLSGEDADRLATLPPLGGPALAEVPPALLSSLLVIVHPKNEVAWCRREAGDYGPAWSLGSAYRYREHALGLEWAGASGLAEWYKLGPKGPVPKAPPQFFAEYSTPLDPGRYHLSFVAQATTYDPATGAFVEAVCPLRRDVPAPRFDADLDAWLQALAGPQYERLVDWLATVTHLDTPAPVLALVGAKSTGKGLFIEGVSRLWHAGRAPSFASLSQGFQEALAQSPLLIADEYLPESGPGGCDIFEYLREFVTARVHTVNRKNMPLTQVHGCARLIYASNKADSLHIRNANQAAKQALAERFVVIRPDESASAYLDTVPDSVKARWIEGGAFAAHVLWLSVNRPVLTHPGRRLTVEGNGHALIDDASNAKGPAGHLCEAIARFLCSPGAVVNGSRDCWDLDTDSGELWVATAAFEDRAAWETLVPSLEGRRYSTAQLGTALATLSHDSTRRRYTGAQSGRAQQRVMHRVDLAQVFAFAVRTGMADTAYLEAAIRGALPGPGRALSPLAPNSTPSGLTPGARAGTKGAHHK